MITDLHQWILATLSADAALQAELGDPLRIYTTVPRRRVLPCLILGRIEATDWSTDTEDGLAFVVTMHAWSREANRAQLYRIADRMLELLRTADPDAGGARVVLVTQLAASYAREREQDAFHGRFRFRFLCEPAV